MPKGKNQIRIPDKDVKPHKIPEVDREKIKQIADKARRLRTEMKISYEEFAINAGINRNSYFRFEKSAKTCENYTVALLLKVIRGLNMTVAEFFQDIR